MERKLALIALLTMTLAWNAPAARAQDWQYDLYIYGLGAGLDGVAGVGPIDADVDLGVSDLLDNLELGVMGSFRAKKGDWAVMTDLIFTGLGASGPRADVDVDMVIFEAGVAYRFAPVFELLFGARSFDIDADVALRGPRGLAASGGESWVDPFLGLRLEAPLSDNWLLVGRLDAGGVGVGADSSFNFAVHFGYRFSDGATLTLGWRHLDVDYEDGEGLDRFRFDVQIAGPQVGVAFHF